MNHRLTVLSPSGEIVKTIPVDELTGRDIVPLETRVLFSGLLNAADVLWATVSSDGQVAAEEGVYPEPDLAAANPYLRQSMASQQGDTWALAFPWGNRLFVYRDTSVVCEGTLIEGRPVSAAKDQHSTIWVVEIDVDGDGVFTLAKGETPDALRLVDEYSSRDCSYRRTYRLPRSVLAMEVQDGVFYVAREEPYISITGLKPVKQRKPSDARP